MRWLAMLLFIPMPLAANEAEIVRATADCNSERVCRFNVTVRHADTGWEHYADNWRLC